MTDYTVVDSSEHDDHHRGFVDIDGQQLSITVTHEGLVIDLYDDAQGQLVGTFANTFRELAEFVEDD